MLLLVPTHEAEELATLRVDVMRESLERVGRFDASRARERFLTGFSAECTRNILDRERKVGIVVVRPHGDGLLLDHLYVHSAGQGRGVGAAVLSIVFAEADSKGMSIRVGALKESRSNDFYLKHGFTLVERGEWDNYYVRKSQDPT